jgi:hypothetical protein
VNTTGSVSHALLYFHWSLRRQLGARLVEIDCGQLSAMHRQVVAVSRCFRPPRL